MLDYKLSDLKKICQAQDITCSNCPIGTATCEKYFGGACPCDWVIDEQDGDEE